MRVEDVLGDDARMPRCGDEELTPLREVAQLVDPVTVERGLEGLDLIDLGHGHAAAEGAQVLCDPPAAPAVTRHDESPARDHQVRDAHDALDDRLADAVTILADRLQRAVVDDDRRERHLPREFGTQADAAAGGLFGAADHGTRGTCGDDSGREVGAVVEQDVGPGRDHGGDVRLVLLEGVVARAEHRHALAAQERDHVVLGRAVVTRGDDLRAACSEHLEQHCGLRLHMQRHAHATSGERLPGGEFATGGGEERHPRSDPGSASGTALDEFVHGSTLSYMNVVFTYGIGCAPATRASP